MQFYLNGYHPGDPRRAPAADPAREQAYALGAEGAGDLADGANVDVLIVGGGPAGLVLGAQLAQFPEITTALIDRREGPLQLGQADGISCRTMEMFETFGIAAPILEESYWVNETVFWEPNPEDPAAVTRVGRVRDVAEDLSHMPHVILNQARVHQLLTERMADSPTRNVPHYGHELVSLEYEAGAQHPNRAVLRRPDGAEVTVSARYVVGCDGARSLVRSSIGARLQGDSRHQVWGVMDALIATDFPDIRFKAVVKSAEHGNMLIIPREGGYLVRFYIELDELQPGERVRDRGITAEQVIEAARKVIAPHTFEVKEIAWWSVYEIGQRVTDAFDNSAATDGAPTVFLAGDACHTHSPKAGQGMNVSMQDTLNLGWKLAAVLRGAAPESLLRTYGEERKGAAQDLIDLDTRWAGLMGGQADDSALEGALERQFVEQGRYTAGVGTTYAPSTLTSPKARQELATGFGLGQRFHSAPVVRIADAKHVQLGDAARADGRWRVYLFGDAADIRSSDSVLARTCERMLADSPLTRYTPAGADVDAVFDVRAVLQQSHHEVAPDALPTLLAPTKGRYGLTDFEKAFSAVITGGGVLQGADTRDIYERRGISRDGCIVVVRPDQYVSHILPLDAVDELTEFFAGILLPA